MAHAPTLSSETSTIDGSAIGMIESQPDAALAAVGVVDDRMPRPIFGTSPSDLQAALCIAGFGVLDLDDIGAPVGEHTGRRRREGVLGDLDDADALHRM